MECGTMGRTGAGRDELGNKYVLQSEIRPFDILHAIRELH